MSRLDERLRQEIRRLGPETQTPDDAFERVAARKLLRRRVRYAQFAALTLIVIVGTVAGTYGLTRVFRVTGAPTPGQVAGTEMPAPEPTEEPTPEPTEGAWTKPVTLAGVPFPVCNVIGIPWRHSAEGIGSVFVFEEARRQGCNIGYEGFQHVGVSVDGNRVDAHTDRLKTCRDRTDCWPYAVLELDGDRWDEVIIGLDAADDQIWVQIFDVGPGSDGSGLSIQPVQPTTPEATRPEYAIFTLDTSLPKLSGLSCGRFQSDGSWVAGSFVYWASESGDGWEFSEYTFEGGTMSIGNRGVVSHGDPRDFYAPSDADEICLQPAFVPENFR